MYISQESAEQTQIRLSKVIAGAELKIYDLPYTFVEVGVDNFPLEHLPQALAFVRDEQVWSALVPSASDLDEKFLLFSFHFTPGLDNSGFVGWLASHMKKAVGSGVMVVCGQNTNRGGIFDYWGAPIAVANEVVSELRKLRGKN
jgi:Family of unknown function (DUF6196)